MCKPCTDGYFLPRDAMQARPMPSCGVCLSVCVSVTFVYSVKTNKHIFKFFSPSDSQTILVIPYQTSWQYSDGDALTGASNASGVGTDRDTGRIPSYRSMSAAAQTTTTTVTVNSAVYCTERHASVILFITTIMVNRDEERRTKQNLIVRSGKSEADLALDVLYYCSY